MVKWHYGFRDPKLRQIEENLMSQLRKKYPELKWHFKAFPFMGILPVYESFGLAGSKYYDPNLEFGQAVELIWNPSKPINPRLIIAGLLEGAKDIYKLFLSFDSKHRNKK